MRKHYSILPIILFLFSLLFAGAPDTLWTRTYGRVGEDEFGSSVQQTSDGGFIIVGYTYTFEEGDWDIYLLRINPKGDTLWTKTYGGIENDGGSSIQVTKDGGFIIAGHTYSFGAGQKDIYLIRTNSEGDTLWTKTYGSNLNEMNGEVKQTSDSGFIIVGSAEISDSGETDVYLIRTDSKGDTLWTKTYDKSETDVGTSVQQTSDSGFVIAGFTQPLGIAKQDVYLLRIDLNGDTLWTKTYGGIKDDYATSIDLVSDGGFVITGTTDSYDGTGRGDVYLLRIDSNGDTLWSKTYGGSEQDNGVSVKYTNEGKIVITGASRSFSNVEFDIYTICTNLNGNIIWDKILGGIDRDISSSIQQTNDGGFVIVGFTRSFTDSISDVYLIRLDKDTTGIQQEIPSNFINPNNFIVSYNNGNISIRYTIPYSSSVKLEAYDIKGKLVQVIQNKFKNKGSHSVRWESKMFGSGVYFIKLSMDGTSISKKFTIIK